MIYIRCFRVILEMGLTPLEGPDCHWKRTGRTPAVRPATRQNRSDGTGDLDAEISHPSVVRPAAGRDGPDVADPAGVQDVEAGVKEYWYPY